MPNNQPKVFSVNTFTNYGLDKWVAETSSQMLKCIEAGNRHLLKENNITAESQRRKLKEWGVHISKVTRHYWKTGRLLSCGTMKVAAIARYWNMSVEELLSLGREVLYYEQ